MASGANVNAKDDHGVPLVAQLQIYNLHAVDLLANILMYHPDLSWTDDNGDSLAMLAVKAKDVDILRLFMQAGVDLTLNNRAGLTALTIAVELSYHDAVQLLLDAGMLQNEEPYPLLESSMKRNDARLTDMLTKAFMHD